MRIILLLTMTCCMMSCNSKGGGQATLPQAAASDTPAPAAQTLMCQSALCTARTDTAGQVWITFNKEQCRQLAEEMGHQPSRALDGQVLGLEEPVVQLLITNMGNSENPFLVMRTSGDHVAMLSILDAILHGDMQCSGPLRYANGDDGLLGKFITGVTGIASHSDEDGTAAVASLNDGSTVILDYNYVLDGAFTVRHEGTMLRFTPSSDWGLTLTDLNTGQTLTGSFALTGARFDEATSRQTNTYVASLDRGLFGLDFTVTDDQSGSGEGSTITFTRAAREFPLPTGQPLPMERQP